MKRECIAAGCRALIARGSRCPEHSSRRSAEYERNARATREAAGSHCPGCGEPYTDENPATADHIVRRRFGGSDARANLRPLCRRCNSRKG